MRFLALILLASLNASAATYYIDWESGNDSNNGTSTNTPWKRHPDMQGFGGGSFTAQPGDRFILKGGVTWPNAALSLYITDNGTSENRIYVGIDTNWYSGDQWVVWTNGIGQLKTNFNYPVLDAQGTNITDARNFGGGSSGTRNCAVAISGDYITIDGLCIKGVRVDDNWAGGTAHPDAGTDHTLRIYNAEYFIGQNLYLCDWVVATVYGGDVGGAIMTGTSPGSKLIDCRIKGPENIDPAYITEVDGRDFGNAVQFFGFVQGCDISRVGQGIWNCGIVASNIVHTLGQYTDPDAHENALWAQNNTTIYGNVFKDAISLVYLMPGWGSRSGQTTIAYNNIFIDVPAVRLNPQQNPDESNQLWFFNNIVKRATSSVMIGTTKAGDPFGTLVVQNNLFISDGGNDPSTLVSIVDSNDLGDQYTNSHNAYLSTAQATALGLTASGLFAPGNVIASLSGQGVDFSSKTTQDFLGVTRSGSWDIGAYQYQSEELPQEPNGPASITGVSPSQISRLSGGSIAVTGTNFFGVTNVTVGEASVEYTVETPGVIFASVPTEVVGVFPVRVYLTNSLVDGYDVQVTSRRSFRKIQ